MSVISRWSLPVHAISGTRGILLLGVVADVALGQRLLQLVNLSLGEGGVVVELQLS